MERAVRVVTVERGVDARDLALVAFGGAGPLHACAVAGSLGMRAVIIPPRAGVLSAVGLVCSPRQRQLVRSWAEPMEHAGIDRALDALAAEAAALVGGGPDVDVERLVDCRYAGQSHELTVADPAAFAAEHERRNGFARPGAPVEIVALRVRARRPAPLAPDELPAVDRRAVRGPEVVAEPDCTVWVPDGWRAQPGPLGAWVLQQT
jgi:N-methylhydantoinase A/oxoprolinase/acetone carboxylase beta subunit